MSVQRALLIDVLLDDLITAARSNDLTGLRWRLEQYFQDEAQDVNAPDLAPTLNALITSPSAELDWAEMERLIAQLLDRVFFDLVSALEAEWTSLYFSGAEAVPMFFWVAPRVSAQISS